MDSKQPVITKSCDQVWKQVFYLDASPLVCFLLLRPSDTFSWSALNLSSSVLAEEYLNLLLGALQTTRHLTNTLVIHG